jgi:NADPH-dependent curcumin reductase CurA
MGIFLKRRVRLQGFIIFDDYGPRFPEFQQQMGAWFAAGKIKVREDMVEGLEQAPAAFIGMLQGRNFGKLVVHVDAATTY